MASSRLDSRSYPAVNEKVYPGSGWKIAKGKNVSGFISTPRAIRTLSCSIKRDK